jgi:hypothetical protein
MMTLKQSFALMPFPAPAIPQITITGNISRQSNLLALHYSVAGKIEDILLPSPSAHPDRKDDLWKTTCFEFFLASPNQPQYWEFNMSPSGDWNIYHMDTYRRAGFREEMSIQRLPFALHKEADRLRLNVNVDLSPLFLQTQPLEMAITAVIQTKHRNETYWALAHQASQADFHLRESFTLVLADQTHPSPQSALGN